MRYLWLCLLCLGACVANPKPYLTPAPTKLDVFLSFIQPSLVNVGNAGLLKAKLTGKVVFVESMKLSNNTAALVKLSLLIADNHEADLYYVVACPAECSIISQGVVPDARYLKQ